MMLNMNFVCLVLIIIVNVYVLDRLRICLLIIIKWNILLVEFYDMIM